MLLISNNLVMICVNPMTEGYVKTIKH